HRCLQTDERVDAGKEQRARAQAVAIEIHGTAADVVEIVHVEDQRAALPAVDAEVLQVEIGADQTGRRRSLRKWNAGLQHVSRHELERAWQALESRVCE